MSTLRSWEKVKSRWVQAYKTNFHNAARSSLAEATQASAKVAKKTGPSLVDAVYYNITGSLVDAVYYNITGSLVDVVYYNITGSLVDAVYYNITGSLVDVVYYNITGSLVDAVYYNITDSAHLEAKWKSRKNGEISTARGATPVELLKWSSRPQMGRVKRFVEENETINENLISVMLQQITHNLNYNKLAHRNVQNRKEKDSDR